MNELKVFLADTFGAGLAEKDQAAMGYRAYDTIYRHLERLDAAAFVLSQTLKSQLLDDTELKST